MRPAFIDGPAGQIFVLYHPPAPDAPDRGDLIFVPPFAEELNRSRHMIARAARAFAAAGHGVLLLDLYGTGDSAGEFAQARWDIWQGDILAARRWLVSQGRTRIGLWAMRSGALLAACVLQEAAWTPLLFWQPVAQGKTFLAQFLRIGLAAGFTGSADTGGIPLRDRLARGETLEIAGYALHPDLATALEAAVLTPATVEAPVYWLEVSATAPEPSPGQARAAAAWREVAAAVRLEAVAGPQFWTLQEPEWAPDLIAASLALLGEAA